MHAHLPGGRPKSVFQVAQVAQAAGELESASSGFGTTVLRRLTGCESVLDDDDVAPGVERKVPPKTAFYYDSFYEHLLRADELAIARTGTVSRCTVSAHAAVLLGQVLLPAHLDQHGKEKTKVIGTNTNIYSNVDSFWTGPQSGCEGDSGSALYIQSIACDVFYHIPIHEQPIHYIHTHLRSSPHPPTHPPHPLRLTSLAGSARRRSARVHRPTAVRRRAAAAPGQQGIKIVIHKTTGNQYSNSYKDDIVFRLSKCL